jgi:hypothetical protein
MKVKWSELKAGDFFYFKLKEADAPFIYQKINPKSGDYNTVLLNTGELCCVHESDNLNSMYDKVDIEFKIYDS